MKTLSLNMNLNINTLCNLVITSGVGFIFKPIEAL